MDSSNVSRDSFEDSFEVNFKPYNGHHTELTSDVSVGNMAMLPLKTRFKGPAERLASNEVDIIDEVLLHFKPSVFFKSYEIKGDADRTFIYLMLYTVECLKKLTKSPNKAAGVKDLLMMAFHEKIPMPGDPDFPLNQNYQKPANTTEYLKMRAYLEQLRQELGVRLCDRCFDKPDEKASKWWVCFARRRFMGKNLVYPGTVL
ncbi:hypothetical protein L596_000739 [Steinernema carpocapsae]|uniref:Actin-related protein 2/3 complex subunit 3 n=1 Tax=Steinernema carpocapsae TaxID=34508 RepID=A0A4U8UJT1_STECR|nr:hypothetical protein L596_000739 [Steinernema carpocapsae]